jgi:hydroxymethylpyrimidine pyrophosphatase-like HAD family hydrolase
MLLPYSYLRTQANDLGSVKRLLSYRASDLRFQAIATDFDGTLAQEGQVARPTISSLMRFSATGRKLILVTGRELDSLKLIFPRHQLFNCIVAENGALMYQPKTSTLRVFANPPPQEFLKLLIERGVSPLSVGHVIVATVEPQQSAVRSVINELGLDLQIVMNRESVMVLPATVDKASGLKTAVNALGLEMSRVVGIGDAENDATFLSLCGHSAAVANAVPSLKSRVDRVTQASYGSGVAELICHIMDEDN